jgi:hypothetical protein
MILGTEFQFVLIWGIVTITVSNKRPNGAKIDVSVIFIWRVYFSSDFDGFFLMHSLGKSLSEKYIVLLCNYYHF